MKFYRIFLFVVAASLYITTNVIAQTVYFPLQNKTRDDFSSAFGPRNLGTANYPSATDYDYDFHGGIDIGAPLGTNVYPILDGTVYQLGPATGVNRYIVIKHTYSGSDIYIKYMHLIPSSGLVKGSPVTANSTVLGTLLDYTGTGGAHLDFRYYKTESLYLTSLDNGCWNPGTFLNATGPNAYTTEPVLVDKDANVISTNTSLSADIDAGTTNHNPSDRRFLTFGVRCYGDELDIVNVNFDIGGKSRTISGKTYVASDLLYGGSQNFAITRVQYEARTNCGDIAKDDDDDGHNSTTIGIYPRKFSSSDSYHTVYFRWYLNETVWNDCLTGSVKADIYASDWSGKGKTASSIPVVTIVGPPPNPDVPSTPTMQSIVYDETAGKIPTIQLTWQNSSTGADFYRIYRCPFNETISDNDYIGIAPYYSGSTSYYIDSDSRLMPGETYRYVVAGVNKNGESTNSNELTILFKGELPQTIGENSLLSGTWLCKQDITLSSGYTLTIGPNTLIKVDDGKNVTFNGKLIVDANNSFPVLFTSNSTNPSEGSWGSIVLDGPGASGSSLNYVNMKYGTEIRILNNAQNITIQNSTIENTINGIYAYTATGSIINNAITNPRDHGINLIVSPITCNQNVITKASGNSYYHSGGGIICQSGSYGDIWKNTISGFNWGIGAIWGSSPQFRNNSNAGVNNSVTNCLYSVMTYQYSYPTIGPDPESHYYYRYEGNSFSGSQYYDFYADTYSGSDAYGAFWGGGPSYWLGTGCWFNYESFPQIAGGGPEPTLQKNDQRNPQGQATENDNQHTQLAAQQGINQRSGKMSLLDGVELRSNGKYREAKDFFLAYIAKHPNDQAAYVELYNCYSNETSDEITNFFISLPKDAAKEHKLLLSYLHLKRGNVGLSKQINSDVVASNTNTRIGIKAKLNNFYVALYNENDPNGASRILDEISSRATLLTPMELSIARDALESYGGDGFGQPANKSGFLSSLQVGLSQNYPNPFNPTTTIAYRVTQPGTVSLKVFDVLGREVATLVNTDQNEGVYTQRFDASRLSSGIYFYHLIAPGVDETRKMLIAK